MTWKDETPIIPRSRASLLAAAAAVFLASCLAYANTLFNGFVYDDIPQIVRNPWIRDLRHLGEIFSTNVWAFAGTETNYYRPLMHLGYLVSYHLFGTAAWGFHLVNVVLHGAVALLVLLTTVRLLDRRCAPQESADLAVPLAAALLFAVHPIHTEVVAWIGGFTDLAFTFLCLLSFQLFVLADSNTHRVRSCQILAAVSFFLATLCKEPAVTFPALLVAYDWAFNGRNYGVREYGKRYAPFLVALAAYFALRIGALGAFSPVSRHSELTFGASLANAFPLFAAYLGKLVLPTNLNAWHVFHPLSSLWSPRGILSLAAVLAFVAGLVWAAMRNALLFLALAIVAVPLLPTLYVPAMGENPFAERYLYLPSVGFAMLAAFLLARVAALGRRGRAVAAAVFLVTAALFTYGTVARNPVWKDDYTFWTDAARKSPDGPIPHYNLGTVLAARGDLDGAIAQYETAISLKPAAVAYKSMAAAYRAKGVKGKAIEAYRDALRLEPGDVSAHLELGVLYGETGRVDLAIEQFENAVQEQPGNADARYDLGLAYLDKGMPGKAVEQFEMAVRLNPSEPLFSAELERARRSYSR